MERTTSTGLLLQKLTQPQPHPHLILICPQLQPLSPCHWTHLIKCPNISSSHSNPRSTSVFRPATRWDSDAEPSSGNPGEKRRWWSDEDPPDSDSDAVEAGGLAWGEAFNSLWVVKVFKSFGWFLPFILPSCYLFTDPEAFLLMVSAVTLVQSLVVASQKLLGMTEKRPKGKAKTRKKPFSSRTSINKDTEEELEETKRQTPGYQTWAAGSEDSIKRDASSNFGGWEDLDESGYVQTPQSRPSRSREKPMKKAKVSWKRRSSTPLLLRLLISVFPFLSSLTKML